MKKCNKTLLLVTLFSLTAALVLGFPNVGSKPVSAQEDYKYYLPIFQRDGEPMASSSYYMITIEPQFSYDLGCEIGTRDAVEPGAQDSVVVLAFSYPVDFGNGTYGTELYGFGPVPISDIEVASKGFMQGYYDCTGADTASNLVLGLGTNNKPTSTNTAQKMINHGTAWAEMVNRLNQWATEANIIHQVQAYGASDIELGWNSPVMSKAWLSGYESAANAPLIHFGDAAGCPYEDNPTWGCGTSSHPEWTIDDVWYVSWGAPPSIPLPLIYLTNGIHAKQWAFLSRYGVSTYGSRMNFTGVFTQSQACAQYSCSGTDNTPSEAYRQLSGELNKSSDTAQKLNWATDIRWILRNEAYPSIYSDRNTTESQGEHSIHSTMDILQTEIQNPDLNPATQINLMEKFSLFENLAVMIWASEQNPAPKGDRSMLPATETQDPEFRAGIIPGGDIAGLPYGAVLTNVWQDLTSEGYLQIGAGTSPENPSQGVVFILMTSLDKTSSQALMLLGDEESGALQIVAVSDDELVLQAEDGTRTTLELDSLTLR